MNCGQYEGGNVIHILFRQAEHTLENVGIWIIKEVFQHFLSDIYLVSSKLHSLSKEELILALEKEKSGRMKAQHELAQLKRMIFGQKRERFVSEPSKDQLTLFGDLEKALETPPNKQKISYEREAGKKRKAKPFRQPLPASFPRERIVLTPEGDISSLKKIGEEITEELEYIPQKFIVRQWVREKFIDPKDENRGVMLADLPSRPIEKGIPGPGLLAHIQISKFADHLPLYRQAQQFKRLGYEIPRSTLGGWQSETCQLLDPLYRALRDQVLASGYLQADETPIAVHDKKKKGKMKKGYHWVYLAVVERLALFDYRPGRSRAGPAEILQNFKGWLQTDGYSTYDAFEEKQGIFLVACLAHIRRYFENALDNQPEQAEQMLLWIQQLYTVEREAREKQLGFEERKKLREEKAAPVIETIREWLIETERNPTSLPEEPIRKATNYLRNRFQYLERYLLEGRLEIDNNLVENQIRPVALGRKNYLFAGSDAGAKQAAMIYSFMATCKLNEVEPFHWLADVIKRSPNHKINRIDELLPHNWKKGKS